MLMVVLLCLTILWLLLLTWLQFRRPPLDLPEPGGVIDELAAGVATQLHRRLSWRYRLYLVGDGLRRHPDAPLLLVSSRFPTRRRLAHIDLHPDRLTVRLLGLDKSQTIELCDPECVEQLAQTIELYQQLMFTWSGKWRGSH